MTATIGAAAHRMFSRASGDGVCWSYRPHRAWCSFSTRIHDQVGQRPPISQRPAQRVGALFLEQLRGVFDRQRDERDRLVDAGGGQHGVGFRGGRVPGGVVVHQHDNLPVGQGSDPLQGGRHRRHLRVRGLIEHALIQAPNAEARSPPWGVQNRVEGVVPNPG